MSAMMTPDLRRHLCEIGAQVLPRETDGSEGIRSGPFLLVCSSRAEIMTRQ